MQPFRHQYPERVADHTNGDIAANSYTTYIEDVAAIKEVGVSFLMINHFRY